MSKERKPLKRTQKGQVIMSTQNIMIALSNQQTYFETLELNEILNLQYYAFENICNLSPFIQLHTLYLNNNSISLIQNLNVLPNLIFLNLANNRIAKIQNLQNLTKLKTLDLSHNKIVIIQNLQIIPQLLTLNLNSNLITYIENVTQLKLLQSLSSLNLSDNQIEDKLELYQILAQMSSLTVLYLKNTTFSRGIKNYRKQTIYALKKLMYLDDRPVTAEDRMVIVAWKEGGVAAENIARKEVFSIREMKQHKDYNEMMQRCQKVEQLREKTYNSITYHEQSLLKNKLLMKENKNNMSLQQYDLICLEITELEQYLELMHEQVKSMDVGQKQQIKMLVEKDTADAIYVYNISEEDLPFVKEKFFKEEMRPIIAKNYQKKIEERWIQPYQQILNETLEEHPGNINKITAIFNLKIYKYDELNRRKIKRFTANQIFDKINNRNNLNTYNQLNQID